MKKEAFEVLKKTEGSWWHKGRQHAATAALAKVGVSPEGKNTILDAGAGYGSMFEFLSRYGEVDGFEPEITAQEALGQHRYRKIVRELDALQKEEYGLIAAFDVIEHVENDTDFVKQLFALTKSNGILVATVPAFQFLWGIHDVKHMHYRRHTTKSMKRLLENAGYKVQYARYWNCFLFPIAVIMRIFGKTGESGLSPSPWVNRLLLKLLSIEAELVSRVQIPFGLSVIIIGVKR